MNRCFEVMRHYFLPVTRSVGCWSPFAAAAMRSHIDLYFDLSSKSSSVPRCHWGIVLGHWSIHRLRNIVDFATLNMPKSDISEKLKFTSKVLNKTSRRPQ
jgi:hypothetical protein